MGHCPISKVNIFSPANFDKFAESNYYFFGNILVLLKLLTTSAKVPGSTPGHG